MHFGIFVPDFTGNPIEALAHAGCAELHSDGDLAPSGMQVTKGPDDRPGLIIQWIDASRPADGQPACDYDATWEWMPDPTGKYFLGINWNDRPRPAELLRWRPESFGRKIALDDRIPRFDGPTLTLGDKQLWTMPNQWELPMSLVLDPKTGEYVDRPKRGSKPLFDEMHNAFEQAVKALTAGADENDVEGTWSFRDMLAYSAKMLGLNYRGTEFVFTTLEVIDRKNVLTCVAQSTDVERMQAVLVEREKKRAAAMAAR